MCFWTDKRRSPGNTLLFILVAVSHDRKAILHDPSKTSKFDFLWAVSNSKYSSYNRLLIYLLPYSADKLFPLSSYHLKCLWRLSLFLHYAKGQADESYQIIFQHQSLKKYMRPSIRKHHLRPLKLHETTPFAANSRLPT